MKVFDIVRNDMTRYFRSVFAVGMMVVVPLLITGLIYFAFGGVLASSETAQYVLPVITVQVVNQDEGDAESGLNLGEFIIQALKDESVKDVFAVTEEMDVQHAQAAVDHQESALALLIPENFTQAAINGSDKADLILYQDPTLSFGPGITKEILGQFLDALSGGRIAVSVLQDQFTANGQALAPAVKQQVQDEYAAFFQFVAGEKEWNLPVVKRLPNKETPKSIADHRTTLLGPVFAGMMIFFVFFTGCNTAQSILKEQEEGTLARMFTTPTPLRTILGGKFAAVLITLIVQSIVLASASALLFRIEWGNLAAFALVVTGLDVSGAGFGILVMAFVTSTRQAGALTGGILAVMGMISGLFSQGFNNAPAVMDMLALLMPQGWALRGMKLVLAGARPQDVVVPVLVLLTIGLVFFGIGNWKFRTRFA